MTLLNKIFLGIIFFLGITCFVEYKIVNSAEIKISEYVAQIKNLEISSQERLKTYESAHQRSEEDSQEDAQIVKDIQNQRVPKNCELAIKWAISQIGRV